MTETRPAGQLDRSRDTRIHPTAMVEPEVQVGAGTVIWDNAHIRGPSQIGHDCIVGEKTYIAYGVTVGNFVKINSQVYICTGVTIEDRAMISAGVIFTNDRYPRASVPNRDGLAPSEPNVDTLRTTVREGATIGAGAILGPGIEIGSFSMVGMGAVVTGDVAPHALVYGNPAKLNAYVCFCGVRLLSFPQPDGTPITAVTCSSCQKTYLPQRKGTDGLQLLRK